MYQRLKINTGVHEYAIPSLEGCLKDRAGIFHTAQNAVRIHGWLRSTETDPLVLESALTVANPLVKHYTLGLPKFEAWPERFYPGQMLKLEQTILAMGDISDLIAKNLERAATNAPGADPTAMNETLTVLMQKVSFLSAFNASAMYFQHEIPVRACYETLDTLNILFTCIITQREQRIYEPPEGYVKPLNILPALYNKMELDKVIARIHEGAMTGFFPNPAFQVKQDALLHESFFKQCAMAFSATCTVSIPVAYFEPEPTDVYAWAVKTLNDLKARVPTFQVRPKIQTVTNLFTKN